MKDTKYLEIIKAPVITEKSENARSEGQYTFKVDSRANKTEIKQEKHSCSCSFMFNILHVNRSWFVFNFSKRCI